MDHLSANLAFGGREKNIWGYKKLQGGKKPLRKTEKKVATFFLFLFGDSKKFVGGGKKINRGAPNGCQLWAGCRRLHSSQLLWLSRPSDYLHNPMESSSGIAQGNGILRNCGISPEQL